MESVQRPRFPQVPRGWYYLCASRALDPGPVGIDLGAQRFVGFRDRHGAACVLEARCSHMRADLSRGCVRDGELHCPLHDWRYAGNGRCVGIPALATSQEIPPFARQARYPTNEIGGHVVFCNAPTVEFPMPFYDGKTPNDLLPARPFDFVVDTPWYMIGANAFDLQHFRVAHDRTVRDTPVIESPSPFARRITATYDVTGRGWRDEITRRLSGPTVRMAVTVWSGTNILVTAEFKRTTSYGMVFVRPLGEARTHLRTIVWVPRRKGTVARRVIDPLDGLIRRGFIRAFMADDANRSDGVRYNPATLIDADAELARYFDWLIRISHGNGGSHDAEDDGGIGAVDRVERVRAAERRPDDSTGGHLGRAGDDCRPNGGDRADAAGAG